MNAYDRMYLEKARIALGRMLDYAVYGLKYDLSVFWDMFLVSKIARRFEQGDASVIAGRSGVELALMVTGKDQEYPKPVYSLEKSEEYWVGWALAYYQWKTCLSFSQITSFISIEEMRRMYSPYHEMDVRQFCDRISELYIERKEMTNLKRRRLAAGISQSQLAQITGIPVRTIQQYEQGQKDINRARAEYVIHLSRALYCDPQQLLEYKLKEE
ncbi:MAG: helix-turn-helix transcriptional regulator [Erysipelotrichaceae bacterium]|nr:helix-turn-helix transcriptional regulator [Erysipelotrichaceae bacterium]